MSNRDIYQRDPDRIALLNHGVAAVTDEVGDLLREVATLGRRLGGLHAAAGTVGADRPRRRQP